MSKCFDCKERFELNELHLIKAPTLNGRAWQCQPCHVLELKRIRDINQSIHAGRRLAMSDFIDRARALGKAATEGPWEASLRDPADPLDATVIDAEACNGMWVASSDDDEREYENAEFIAAARTMLPAAVEALARVRELHRKHGLYELEDACTNTSEEHRQERHHEASDDVGEFYCEDMPIGAVCDECRDEDGERLDWPCATYQATEVEA